MSASRRFIIRQAVASDRARIGVLWRELMTLHSELDSRFRIMPDGEQRYVRHIHERIRTRDSRVFVAQDVQTRQIVGYILGELQTRPPIAMPGIYGFISDICVQQDWRGEGVGQALFEEMREWLRTRKALFIELYVSEANPDSNAFWNKMGFNPFLKLMHLDLEKY